VEPERLSVSREGAMTFSFFRTIRTHLLLLVLISALPALGIIIYSGFQQRSQAVNTVKSDALQVVKNFSYDHERAVESTRQFIMTLAKVPDIRNMNVAASNNLLSQLLKQNPLYSTLFVVNAEGFVYATGLPPLPPTPISVQQRRYFQEVIRIDDFAIGEYAICPAVKRPVLHFAYPIKDANGQFKGAVALSLDLAHYAKMFPMDKLPQGSILALSDYKGVLLYRYPGKEDNIPKPEAPDVIKEMLSRGEEGLFTNTGTDGVKRLDAYKRFHLSSKEPPYLYMRIGIPEDKALLPAKSALLTNLMLLCLAVIGIMFVAWFLGNATIVKRLNILVDASRKLGHGDLTIRTGLDYTNDELGGLARTFDEMAEGLERKHVEREEADGNITKAAEEWKTTFNSITDVVMILDNELKIIRVNQATAGFFDMPIDKIVGNSCFSLMHGTDKPPEMCPFKEMMTTRKHAETEFYDEKRGIWIAVSMDPVFNNNGRLEGVVHIMKDITNRKYAEEALRESENKFRDLAEKSLVGIYLVQDAVFTYVNSRFAEMHGYTVEELIDKKGPKDLTCLDDWPDVFESVQKRMSSESGPTFLTFREITKDNRMIDVEAYGSRTVYQGKTAIIGTMVDITDRRRQEEALKQSEEHFRTLIEKSWGVIVLYDKDHNRTYVSPTITKVLGYTVEEFLSAKRAGFIHPDDSIKMDTARSYIQANPGENATFISRFRHKDGSWRWVENSICDLLDEPTVHSVVVNFHDITERKQAEEALENERQRFQTLAYNAPFGMILEDKDGTITYINPMFKKLFGYTLADIPDGKTWFRKAFPDDKYRHMVIATWFEALKETLQGEQSSRIFSAVAKDGTKKEINFIPIQLSTGEHFISCEDITDRKRLETQLFQSQKMEAIGTLAGGIAHDFNNLLMSILGYTSLMLMDTGAHDPNYEKLRVIEKQVQSGAGLTKQLLGFARGGKYEVKPTDLNELLTKSADLFGRTKKEIHINRKYADDLLIVEVDRVQIEQVLLNIFVNAWQAMPEGGTMHLETRNVFIDESLSGISSLKPGQYAKISVTDTGVGMDEETQRRIFEPFFTTKEMGRGTGLGLAAAYGIIKGHGGIINVYSEKGRGTTFNIYLPVSEKKMTEEKIVPNKVLKGTETGLLVDDQEAVIAVGKAILHTLGYTVIMAKNGQEAVEIFESNKEKIDFVILDMIMPGMSGGETYDAIKKINPDIKVILSSGYSLEGQATKILERGCSGFIQKPFNVSDLSRKIREVLGS
jgi:two-component system cell cycle sensor histidine kinase/response regulator CckA